MQKIHLLGMIAATLLSLPVLAAEEKEAKTTDAAEGESVPFEITHKLSEFKPLELVVPAHKKLKITVKNDGVQPIEFESKQLNREKIIQPHSQVIIYLPPLKPGTYKYFNEFDEKVKGFITAKE